MNKWIVSIATAVAMVTAGTAMGQKANNGPVIVTESGIDLVGHSFAYKVKAKNNVVKINNITFYIANIGDVDAPNSRIEYYVSDNDVFNTVEDLMVPNGSADVLIHTQSLGTVKSGKIKKRTVGGGHLKQLGDLTNKYYFAIIDADNVLMEANENNNTFNGGQIPN